MQDKTCSMRIFSIAAVMTGMVCVGAATVEEAGRGISGEKLLQHIRVLADDKFEGRGPATKGEELTVGYLIEQFKAMGLQAGNPDGSWTQDVPMVGVKSASTISLTQNGKRTEIAFPQD